MTIRLTEDVSGRDPFETAALRLIQEEERRREPLSQLSAEAEIDELLHPGAENKSTLEMPHGTFDRKNLIEILSLFYPEEIAESIAIQVESSQRQLLDIRKDAEISSRKISESVAAFAESLHLPKGTDHTTIRLAQQINGRIDEIVNYFGSIQEYPPPAAESFMRNHLGGDFVQRIEIPGSFLYFHDRKSREGDHRPIFSIQDRNVGCELGNEIASRTLIKTYVHLLSFRQDFWEALVQKAKFNRTGIDLSWNVRHDNSGKRIIEGSLAGAYVLLKEGQNPTSPISVDGKAVHSLLEFAEEFGKLCAKYCVTRSGRIIKTPQNESSPFSLITVVKPEHNADSSTRLSLFRRAASFLKKFRSLYAK